MKTNSNSIRHALRSLVLTIALLGGHSSQGQDLLARVSKPLGIAVTPQGAVAAYCDFTSQHGFAFYAPTGTPLGTYSLAGNSTGMSVTAQLTYRTPGGLADTEGMCRLATVPVWGGGVLGLRQDGGLVWYNSALGQGYMWHNLRLLQTDTSSIYDVAQGRAHAFNGQVSNVNANYGDIAFFRGRDARGRAYSGLMATGLSHPAPFPFIQRVRFFDNGGWDSRIIAGSTATTAGALNNARGVAVNAAGTVAAVLPYQSSAGGVDRLYMFRANFDEVGMGLPLMKLGGYPMGGEGLCADRSGNFLIATGKQGIIWGGRVYAGALVRVAVTGNRIMNIWPNQYGMADVRDVALTANSRYAFVAAFQENAILRYRLF